MKKTLINLFTEALENSLELTKQLIVCPNNNLTLYGRVVEGICRRNYFKCHSILILAADEFTGDSILALSRSLIEDMISLEFMKLKGPERMAKKFMDFSSVEQKNDMDFLEQNGRKYDVDFTESINKSFKEVKSKFMRKSGEISHSWSNCDTESMIIELVKHDILKDSEKDMVLKGYQMGNCKIHLSPTDISSYISSTFRDFSKEVSKETGLLFSLVSYIKIADELATVTGNNGVNKNLKTVLETLNQIQESAVS